MSGSSLPRFTGQLLAAAANVGPDPYRALIVGQIGSDGSAVSGQAYQDVESMTNAEVIALFGTKSYLTNEILKVRKKCQARYAIWVVALAPGAGTAATLDLVYAGTATEDRTMTVKPISGDQFSFNVAVVTGDDGAAVATKVKAGLDALSSLFPASNAVVTATLTLTASDLGTLGNKYSVSHSNIPAGITVNTNAGSSRDQFSSGATDPSTSGIFDDLTATRFHSILWPWQDDFSEVEDFLEARNVVSNAFLHGVAFIGFDDTEANIKAKVNGVTPLNSMNLVFGGNRVSDGASAQVEPSDWRMAEFVGVEGLRLTEDVPIGQFISTSALLDAVGGPGSASLAYYNTPLPDVEPVDPALLFDEQEQVNLKDDGYTIIGVNESASSTIMAEVVTTYKFNTRGDEDISFKYLNYVRTSYLALEVFFKVLKANNSQSRLTEGAQVAGRAIQNQASLEAQFLKIYKDLAGPDYTLTQAGDVAEKYFSDNLVLSIDTATGKVTANGQLPIVTQLRDFVVTFQLSFTVGG